ncbi:ComF family protein [Sphingobacterium hotanense]|uniref:ComF family protein n=1 Tax=Sphingobacterium hotanense TaxID=649196 RepID=UPI0011F1B125|nr:phosphoribosyltransferase family protein [Sphingobacterium hotanense]
MYCIGLYITLPKQRKTWFLEQTEGVDKIFRCSNELDLHDKHILLLDDVLTSGATLASAGNTLLDKFPGCRISIATIAKA